MNIGRVVSGTQKPFRFPELIQKLVEKQKQLLRQLLTLARKNNGKAAQFGLRKAVIKFFKKLRRRLEKRQIKILAQAMHLPAKAMITHIVLPHQQEQFLAEHECW